MKTMAWSLTAFFKQNTQTAVLFFCVANETLKEFTPEVGYKSRLGLTHVFRNLFVS